MRFPRAVQALLRRGLAVRDQFVAGGWSLQALAWWRTRLTNQLCALVWPIKTHAANESFAKFLHRHLEEVFTFLTPRMLEYNRRELLPGANCLGEQALRSGARAQGALASFILTALQRALDPLAWLQSLRQSPPPPAPPTPWAVNTYSRCRSR